MFEEIFDEAMSLSEFQMEDIQIDQNKKLI